MEEEQRRGEAAAELPWAKSSTPYPVSLVEEGEYIRARRRGRGANESGEK